ncbi:MAG: DUF2314 domain-containing protein [Beijerinckiaceae bacterium]
MIRSFIAACYSLLSQSDPTPARPRAVVYNYDDEDEDMSAAIAEARKALPHFLSALREGTADHYLIKLPIWHSFGCEHIWMERVWEDGDMFVGNIANTPNLLKDVQVGSCCEIEKTEISDWAFDRGGLLHGAYTMRVMLTRMPDSEAEYWRRRLVPQ